MKVTGNANLLRVGSVPGRIPPELARVQSGDSLPACLYLLPPTTVHGEAWGSGSRYEMPGQDKNLVLILPVGGEEGLVIFIY